MTMIDESAKSQDFFQNHKDKKERRYTTTRIKPRNFLSNIAYVGINREEFYSENFIFDVFLLIYFLRFHLIENLLIKINMRCYICFGKNECQ